MCAVVLRHHNQAARILVEPVHDAWPQVAAGRRQLLEPEEQRIHQRAAAARVLILPRPCMNHHPRRLVHHREVRVLINHVQRNLFRRGLQRSRMRLAGNVDSLASAQLQRGLFA